MLTFVDREDSFFYSLLFFLIIKLKISFNFHFRTQGMSINIVTSRIGAATSPFIKLLNKIHPAAPFVLMSAMSFGAFMISVALPETYKRPTRETLEDMDPTMGNLTLFPSGQNRRKSSL